MWLIWVSVCICVGERGVVILPPPPCWFSLNNSETIKTLTIRAKFGITKLFQSPHIEQNSDGGISRYFRFPNFWPITYERKLPQLSNQS